MEVFIYFMHFSNQRRKDKDQGGLSDQLSLIICQAGFVSVVAVTVK